LGADKVAKQKNYLGMLSDEEKTVVDGLLERYKSHLSIEQIAEGIRVTLANAKELYEDAVVLHSKDRFGRSMSLFISSLEELGKISVLSAMSRIPKNNQKLWSDAWFSFRNHQHKATWGFVNTYSDDVRSHPVLILNAAIRQFALADIGETFRQFGQYVDYHATEKRWLSPNEVTDADVALWRSRVEATILRIETFEAAGLYSERALEIQRDVYSDFNSDRPRRKDVLSEDVVKSVANGPELAKKYFLRLVEERVVDPELDLSVLGIPLTDL
jgi:AbiV family abortive infection protein